MRSAIAVLTHCLAFLSALNVVGWFGFGRFKFSSAIAWDAIFLTGSVTSIISLLSMLVLGTAALVMRETDLKLCKVNQHPISRLPRHLLTQWLWLKLWFHLERFLGFTCSVLWSVQFPHSLLVQLLFPPPQPLQQIRHL